MGSERRWKDRVEGRFKEEGGSLDQRTKTKRDTRPLEVREERENVSDETVVFKKKNGEASNYQLKSTLRKV